MTLSKRFYEPNQDGVQIEETDIEAMRGTVRQQLLEATSAEEATGQYGIGYREALRWMLDLLSEDAK